MLKRAMIKTNLICVFVLVISKLSFGSTIQTRQSGNWTDRKTWVDGILPCQNDSIIINKGDTVFINSSAVSSSIASILEISLI